MSVDLLRALEARKSGPSDEMRAIAAGYAARREAVAKRSPRPAHWLKPAYGSQQYRYALSVGWITDDEHRADHETQRSRRQKGRESAGTRAADPNRWSNPAPLESRQYGADYSTEAARDSRLTMGAKALLQIIRARCGRTMQTGFTKGTMANVIGRSTRTVQRYIAELTRFGYIEAEPRKGWGGASFRPGGADHAEGAPVLRQARGFSRLDGGAGRGDRTRSRQNSRIYR